jgi:hypothetical protein
MIFFFQVTLIQTVYSKHFLLNLVEVNSTSQVAPFLVDLLSSLVKNIPLQWGVATFH